MTGLVATTTVGPAGSEVTTTASPSRLPQGAPLSDATVRGRLNEAVRRADVCAVHALIIGDTTSPGDPVGFGAALRASADAARSVVPAVDAGLNDQWSRWVDGLDRSAAAVAAGPVDEALRAMAADLAAEDAERWVAAALDRSCTT